MLFDLDSVTRFVGVLIPHALWRLSGRRVVPGIHVAENYFHHPISNPQILTAQGQDRFTAKTKGGSRRERVTSKKGTTEAALKTLQRKKFGKIFQQALTAAMNRSRALRKAV